MSVVFSSPRDTAQEHLFREHNLPVRRRKGLIWQAVFYAATSIAIITLVTLVLSIVDGAFGYVAVQNQIEVEELVGPGRTLDSASKQELIAMLNEHLSRGLVRRFDFEAPLMERSNQDLIKLVMREVVKPQVLGSWNLVPSLFQKDLILQEAAQRYPGADIVFRSWLTLDFIGASQSSIPELAGIRTAIMGSLLVIMITILVAFPIGVGAAIYLEEFASDSRLNRIIQVNIYNLSGVPSIIYGLLGLAVFVRGLEPLTSGALFGFGAGQTANGRTVLSAGLTLALLVLPIIIINAQEAIRAVPQSLRDSSYGLGATKWQTVWHHVLPASIDRILTGTILSISRALGETAPIVVVGASTFISVDPNSIFSKFTTLPIQVYQWTARPQGAFRNIAAAAILVLLVLLLTLNASAIIMRNRISKKRRQA
ncbi:phosphate ABC transporter permease PstA [Spirochaeta lutea]|uniref:phosphate ABC transporter permease PstA n=1 Tax=Spirochaeta lutea TaxID=1480694 RepID=UPI00068F5010|nr:phosphate ABC transporter permease PstA [Spirochaeta lutea]